eukprot:TRINITY_DN5588_c0_g2_i1.p2 TRINITY_DN5588_c0_g2~~TRINITY_DN5588_c0_g2_i1.p2  ORF type:complete len:211 (+),score=36.87 TRINITY_DN5588_c0_g2_i1:25-657(+)
MATNSPSILLVGDGASGKTTLIQSIATGSFVEQLSNGGPLYQLLLRYCGRDVNLCFVDTVGNDENNRGMRNVYQDADLVILTFSVISPSSCEAVKTKWAPELQRYAPETPIVLVGTRTDLRTDETALARLTSRRLAPISYSQGLDMKELIGARNYIECSSLEMVGTNELLLSVLGELYPSPVQKKKRRFFGKKKKKMEESVTVITQELTL